MILVTTPTGQIGSKVVALLLEAKAEVRVICRDVSRLSAPVKNAADCIEGSVADDKALARAFKGVESALWITPPGATPAGFAPWYTSFAVRAVRQLNIARVRRVVVVSSGGYHAGNAGPIGALHDVEDEFAKFTGSARFLRNGCFAENFLDDPNLYQNHELAWPLPRNLKVPVCATKDIAKVAADYLKSNSWQGNAAVPIHGPEDLSPVEIAQVFGSALGAKITYRQQTDEQFVKESCDLGSPEFIAAGLLDMYKAVSRGCFTAEPRTKESTTPTTLKSWAVETLKPSFDSETIL